MFALECATDGVSLGRCLLTRDAGFQPRAHEQPRAVAPAKQVCVLRGRRRHVDRQPDVSRADASTLEAFGSDAHDGERTPVERQRPANDAGIPVEAASPEAIAQHCDEKLRSRSPASKSRPAAGVAPSTLK